MLDEKCIFANFLVCQGLSNDDVGVERGTACREIRPGAGFETGDVIEEMFRGLPLNEANINFG